MGCFLHLGVIQLWRHVTDRMLIDECVDDIRLDQRTRRTFQRARSRKFFFFGREREGRK